MEHRTLTAGSPPIRIGFISQVDCAPIVVAQEMGLFRRHKLNVRLGRELGWATVRDKISCGHLDASHSTSGIAISLGLGLNMMRCKVSVPLVLSLQGNAITMSTDIGADRIGRGERLGEHLAHNWKKERPLLLAVPHRFSSNHSLLDKWLKRNGLSNARNLEIISLPGFLMPRHLKAGHIDGFCAAEPWNSESVFDGGGWCPVTSRDLVSYHTGSVLTVGSGFADGNRGEVVALVAALIESCSLCQDPEFRDELISILARKEYVGSHPDVLRNSLGPAFETGAGRVSDENFHIFHGGNTNRPSMDKASLALSELYEDRTISQGTGGSLSTIYREDICMAAENIVSTSMVPQRRISPPLQKAGVA